MTLLIRFAAQIVLKVVKTKNESDIVNVVFAMVMD
jgi:hypothetical protein